MFSGRDIVILRKLKDHPRMIFCSVSPVSAISLFCASMLSGGSGLSSDTSLDVTLTARSGADSILFALSEPSMSTVRPMKSSM